MGVEELSRDAVRIGNCSGYYGDRHSAAHEMLSGGGLDVLTGDYLAEVTMYLLARARQVGKPGYARLFLTQLEEVLGLALDTGTKIVVNAGGLEPGRLAADVVELANRLGLTPRVAHLEGDDLTDRLSELHANGIPIRHLDDFQRLFADEHVEALTANAYLGSEGIVAALRADADVVICPRVTDASLVVGPAVWWHGWEADNLDAIAGAVVAGHLIECGTQVTGGNYSFFREIPDLARPGFPIAEVAADGSCVLTKHPGTGGAVTVGTVTEQLLYEVGSPRYLNPDVTARFDTVYVSHMGHNRVRVHGAVGERPGPLLKVSMHVHDGHYNSASFMLTGLDIEEKARLLLAGLRDRLEHINYTSDLSLDAELVRSDHSDAASQLAATARLRVHVRSRDPQVVGEHFTRAVNAMPLATYPGCHWAEPPGRARPWIRFFPGLVERSVVRQRGVLDGTALDVETPAHRDDHEVVGEHGITPPDPLDESDWTALAPLGLVYGARSGDKGGDANLAVWARTNRAYRWLWHELTVERLRQLIPDVGRLEIVRYSFPRVRAVNFVISGLLQDGALASSRVDVQAKALGEYLRSRRVDLPVSLLTERGEEGAIR